MGSDSTKDQLAQLHDGAFGWAMVCCGRDRDLASDVLQQSYCRILNGDASFGGRSEFSTWVFGVIRFVALEETRRQQKHRQSMGDLETSLHDSGRFDDAEIEHRELSDQLWAAMEQLSDRQREVLHLVFYEELTIEQAAEVLEITVGSARQHYQRGKESLRRILAASREFER